MLNSPPPPPSRNETTYKINLQFPQGNRFSCPIVLLCQAQSFGCLAKYFGSNTETGLDHYFIKSVGISIQKKTDVIKHLLSLVIRTYVLWSDWKVIPCSYATPYCFNCGNLCATCCYGISTSHLVPLHSHVYGHEVLDKITLCFWSTVSLSNFDWFLWNKRHCKEHWILNSIICTFPGFGII